MNYAEAEEYINQIPRFSKVKSEENVISEKNRKSDANELLAENRDKRKTAAVA